MSVAKVTLNGSVIVDMTDATAGASNIEAPYTAYGSTGAKLTGTGSGGGSGITPTGNINITQAGTIDVTNYATATVASGTATAPSTISGSSATVSTGTNTLTLTKTVSVTPSITTAGYIASGTAGNASVSLTANITTQAAQTIHPSTSDQTISSGRYLTGNQTIKAVTITNLSAANIKSGVVVKIGDSTDDDCVTSVTGSYGGEGGGDTVFVVTLSWDDDYFGQDDGAWIPDCTWAQLSAAYSARKTIAVEVDESIASVTQVSGYYDTSDGGHLMYYLVVYTEGNNGDYFQTWYTYSFDSNGVSSGGGENYYFTGDDDATASDVLDGKIFHNANGKQTGNIPTKTSSDLTISKSGGDVYVTAPSGYYAAAGVKYITNGTAGTPVATKGTVSNHSVSITPSVTNTEGYLYSGGTSTGTAVTVSASELVSGTYNVSSSGTADVTNYASISVPSLTLPNGTSNSESGTRKATIDVSYSADRYLNIPTGYNATAQNYKISRGYLGTKTITTNGTYNANSDALDGFSSVTVSVSGGGGGSAIQTGVASATPSSAGLSISFTQLSGEPTTFVLKATSDLATGASPYKVAAVVFDGTSLHGQIITDTNNAQVTYDNTSFSKTYSNGTLTVTSTGPYFQSASYFLEYSYGGGTVDTKDVQVGSGATSITFTDLEDEPVYWSCIFKSNFSTSNGYQRVICVSECGDNPTGLEMDSSAHFSDEHWSSSYSNGSLTITSDGTNAGGYFHQPGYYQLTYAYDDGSSGNYQTKSVTYTPSTSQQTASVSADSGYDALKKVNITVEAMPTMTLPTAASATSSGTSKATITPTTSAQYLNIPVGYNGTAQYYTISATSGGGTSSKNVQAYLGYASRTANSYGATSVTLTVAKTGTYKICWMAWRGSSSGTMGTNLHIGNTTGTNQQTWTGTYGQCITLNNQSLTENQVLTLYATSGSNSRTIYVGNLIIEEQ